MIAHQIVKRSRGAIYRIISQSWLPSLTESSWVFHPSSKSSPEIQVASFQTLTRDTHSHTPLLFLIRNFHPAPFASATIQVQVPPLGESITDGAIATILKNKSDPVEEDEPIVQIETDKVTIDVRSPTSGIIENILVKEGENVIVGHVVASVIAGEAPGKVEGKAPPQPTTIESTNTAATESASSTTPSSSDTTTATTTSTATTTDSHHRHSSISFPPRRTATGDIISMMPVDQAKATLQSLVNSTSSSSSSSSSSSISTPFFRPRPPRMGPPPKPRQELTEREMEIVMLGGAEGW